MPITKTPMHALWTGDFGERTAAHLSALTGCPTQYAALEPAVWPHTARRVVVTWRDEPQLFDRVAQTHGVWGTPWLPVVHEFPMIRVGPLVVPGEGPCLRCYGRRRAQHDRTAQSTAALRASAAAHPSHGVAGFTESQAMIAAGLAVDLLDSHEADGQQAGRVCFYNVLTRALIADTVTGVHGCAECGTPVHPDDGWRHLAADLRGTAQDAIGAER